VDHVTYEDYEKQVRQNIQQLHERLKSKTYQALRFFIVLTWTVNFPRRLRAHLWVKPKKSKVSGFACGDP
jgi:hypothetical protein